MSFPGNGQQPTFKHSLHLALEVPVEAPFWGKALIGIVYACIIANAIVPVIYTICDLV